MRSYPLSVSMKRSFVPPVVSIITKFGPLQINIGAPLDSQHGTMKKGNRLITTRSEKLHRAREGRNPAN